MHWAPWFFLATLGVLEVVYSGVRVRSQVQKQGDIDFYNKISNL